MHISEITHTHTIFTSHTTRYTRTCNHKPRAQWIQPHHPSPPHQTWNINSTCNKNLIWWSLLHWNCNVAHLLHTNLTRPPHYTQLHWFEYDKGKPKTSSWWSAGWEKGNVCETITRKTTTKTHKTLTTLKHSQNQLIYPSKFHTYTT